MQTRVIFLHGASSSGKSTLARALQQRLPDPWMHLSFDHLRDSGSLPMDRFQSGDLTWRAQRTDVFNGFHQSLGAFAGAGNRLIVEHILDTPGWHSDLQQILSPFPVLFVGVFCDVATLNRRETARGDRPTGSAARDAATIHTGLRYDLELDGTAPVETNLARVISALSDPPARSALFDG